MRPLAVLALALLAPALAGCLGATEPLPAVQPGGFSTTSVFPGAYDTSGFVSRPLQPGRFAPLPAEVVDLPSDLDGARMQVGLVLPDMPEGTRVPVVAWASPYFQPLTPATVEAMDFYGRTNLLPHGYALAYVAVRGTADNDGCMEYFGAREVADLSQAITWLGQQPWSNGRVGMFGGSYDGATQWMVASTGNPHLRTIVPVAAVTDPFTLLFSNGTAANRGAWHSTSYWLAPSPATGPWLPLLHDRSPDRMHSMLCPEGAERLAQSLRSTLAPERDAFWQERTFWDDVVANYTGSVFVVQGLQDWNVHPSQQWPRLRDLEDKGLPVKQLLGQWVHTLPDLRTGLDAEALALWGVPYLLSPHVLDYATGNPHLRWDFAEILLRWYDRWLKDDATVDIGPRVQVEDHRGRWRDEPTWPPRDAALLSLHPAPGGALGPDAPTGGEVVVGPSQHLASTFDTGRLGLQGACGGAMCATFTWAAPPPDLRISGLPQVRLRVTPEGPGGQLAAYLYALHPEGPRRIALGSLDLRYAAGGDAPAPVQPGQVLDVVLQLEPTDVHLPPPSALQLVLTHGGESDHATAMEAPTQAGPVRVALGPGTVLLLPVIARGPEVFFEPPRGP
jgi:putative CocE/NonD family hydrolase